MQPFKYSYSSVIVHYTVKEKRGKPDRKPYPIPYGLKNPYSNLKSDIMPRNLNEIVHSWIWLQDKIVRQSVDFEDLMRNMLGLT